MNIQTQSAIDELKRKINQAESIISSSKKTLEKLEKEATRPDYTQIEGIVGSYNGSQMVAEDGTAYDVPSNYAAKTKLVFGDVLKLIDEDGKKLFKQIDRVDRTKVEGILTKKEGEWYLLTDRGSYKVSDTAAEFQGAQLNSEATAFIPKNNLEAPFAAIDQVEGFGLKTKPVKPEVKEKRVASGRQSSESKPAQAPVDKSTEKNVEKAAEEVKEKPKTRKKPVRKVSTSSAGKKSKPSPRKPKPKSRAPKKTDDSSDKKPSRPIDIEDDDLV